ncbi:MAG: InlB B-repeat-containing protein, partial [Oscillospiraceae bacterium]|nr:InlB B-repeat-containing protein [Oscillospiraceae bacterium]
MKRGHKKVLMKALAFLLVMLFVFSNFPAVAAFADNGDPYININEESSKGVDTQDGSVEDGGDTSDPSDDPGLTEEPGTSDAEDGNVEDGNVEDGNVEDGNVEDGNVEDGGEDANVGDGEDANVEDGNVEDGNVEDGNAEGDSPEPTRGTKAGEGDGETEKVTVFFFLNEDDTESYASFDVEPGEPFGGVPEGPTADGYRFDGWYSGDVKATADTTVTESTNFYAVYVAIWTVTFYNRDAEVYAVVEVDQGSAIGSDLPATISREDYYSFWAIGAIVQGGQGNEISVTGARIDSTFTPTADTTIVPDFDKVTWTITFYTDENKTTVVTTKTVNADTSYCLNDIPTVPAKAGNSGRWVYSGGDFGNTVRASADMDVWAAYTQNVFTVTFKVDGSTYETDTYYYGNTLTLPATPVVEGKEFVKWFVDADGDGAYDEGETVYAGGEQVTSDLTLIADLKDEFYVRFVVLDDEGQELDRLAQYFRTAGEAIGTMPQDPFVAGKVFVKWVIQGTDTEVTAETVVEDSMTVVAVFRTIDVYRITVDYYYLNDNGAEVLFNTDLLEAEAHELDPAYIITAPSTTQTDPDQVANGPIYYPETPTVSVTEADFNSDKECTVRIKYVPFTATYDFVYLLKDLTGDGYTEIDRQANVHGVLNSYVTPTVKTYEHYTLEIAQGAQITQDGTSGVVGTGATDKQELVVKYARNDYTLSYETNGGTYVQGGTYKYGASAPVSTTRPTRAGYTFDRWYLDEALTQPAGNTVTINGNTTLYAKWNAGNATYTIIYMREVYDNDTGTFSFVYENSTTRTATVDSTVYAANAPTNVVSLNGYERKEDINGTANAGGTGEDTAVVVKADGSTVLKVYYSLIRYTFTFNGNNGTIDKTGNGTYTITDVVLGMNIAPLWPTVTRSGYYFDGWTSQQFSWIQKTRVETITWSYLENASRNNNTVAMVANWTGSSVNRSAQYWLQQADGTYKIEESYTQTGLNSTNLTAKTIAGYTIHNGTPSGTNPATGQNYPGSGNQTFTEQVWQEAQPESQVTETWDGPDGYSIGDTWTRNGHTYTITAKTRRNGYHPNNPYRYTGYYVIPGTEAGYVDVERTIYCYNFYYDRAQYNITYKFGTTTLTTKSNILFEADISSSTYNYTPDKPANTTEINYSDYTWGGWYDNVGLEGEPYVFDTMPGHNLELYAKWVAPSFTVSFESNGGSAVDSQTVEKYQKATIPATPTYSGHTFEGWYADEACTTLFDWTMPITANTTVYAKWSRSIITYVVKYQDEDGHDVAEDKTVSNPNYVAGQTITEQAISVAGYRPVESSKTLTLSEDNTQNVITFVYGAKGTTTQYTVHYILDPAEYPGNIPVTEPKTVENVPGDTASVIELAAAVDYATLYAAHEELQGFEFFPDAVEKTLVLTASAETNVYYFYYSSFRSASVTVHFVDMNGDPIASDDVTPALKVGKTFTLSRTPIAGWEFYKAVEGSGTTGTPAGDDYKITDANATTGLEFTLVYQKKVTITVNSPDSKQYDGTALTLPPALSNQVTVEGLRPGDTLDSVTLTYTNADNDTHDGRLNAGVATVTPSSAVIKDSGNETVSTGSGGYYKVTYISGNLEVTKINVTIRVEPDRWTGNVYDGTYKKTGFTNPNKGIADYVMISHDGYKTEYLDDVWNIVKGLAEYDASAAGLGYVAISEKDADDYTYFEDAADAITAGLPEDPNYSVSVYVRPGRLEIKKAPLTVTTGSDSKPYDGTPLTNENVTVDGLVEGEELAITTTGSQTAVGNSPNGYEIDWDNSSAIQTNYEISDTLGTLTVTQGTLTIYIAGNKVEETYDGREKTAEGYEVTKIEINGVELTDEDVIASYIDSIDFSGDDSVTETAAGTYPMGLDNTQFSFDNVNESFATVEFIIDDGELKIDPATMTITVSGDGTSKVYTGSEQSYTGTVTATSDHAAFDASKFSYTGSKTASGTNVGTYETELLEANCKYDDANYTVTWNIGDPISLEITKATLKIVITGHTSTVDYNGGEQSVSGYDVGGVDSALFDAQLIGFSGTAIAKGTDAGTYYMGLTEGMFSYSNNNINVTFAVTDGQLVIKPIDITVTITEHGDEVDYDGEEHSVNGYDVSISNPLYTEA